MVALQQWKYCVDERRSFPRKSQFLYQAARPSVGSIAGIDRRAKRAVVRARRVELAQRQRFFQRAVMATSLVKGTFFIAHLDPDDLLGEAWQVRAVTVRQLQMVAPPTVLELARIFLGVPWRAVWLHQQRRSHPSESIYESPQP